MEGLPKKLRDELLRQPDVEILETDTWGLPVQLIKLTYTTVKRAKMDVLMKMILISIQKMAITSADDMAALLSVEPLFARHMTERLQASAMIQKNDDGFMLTELGIERLQSGIFEHPPEPDEKNFYYSPVHHAFYGMEREAEFSGDLSTYRWAQQNAKPADSLEQSVLADALREAGIEASEAALQIVIDHVDPPELLEEKLAPCIEFHLLNQTEDRRYTRVWNTFLNQWDETLEEQINDHGPLTT